MSDQTKVSIWTDGACSRNPGAGGWGVILRFGDKERELWGGEDATTNNRMELMAAISAFKALNRPCDVDIYTDSQYVQRGMLEWLPVWKSRNWRTVSKKPVKNVDLWQSLDSAVFGHKVRWHWVEGHSGHTENDRADELARRGINDRPQQDLTSPPILE